MRKNSSRVASRFLNSTALSACLAAAAGSASAQTVGINQQYVNQYGLALIGADAAYRAGYTGQGVTIAVGDTGVAINQPPFAGKIDPRSRNYLIPAGGTYDPNQLTPLSPADTHGSHVAGIVAAANNDAATVGSHGVAFNANLLLLRMVPSGGSTVPDNINQNTDPLNYLATLNDVRIFNASFGPSPPDGAPPFTVWPVNFTDTAEAAAAQNALAAGKIIVAATGNERGDHPIAGRNPNGLALYPFMQPSNASAGVYADGGNNFNFSALQNQPGAIIAVTAIDANKAIASFANLCGVTASWCVAAPGVDVLSVVPTTADPSGFKADSGTSMAAPHVSGALGVLSQAFPTYNSQDLTRLLFATTEDLGAAGVDGTFGYGLIRLDRAIAGPTTLAAGADVAVGAFQTTYWSQPLTTAGAFSKSGLGDLVIAGRTTAGGDMAVNAGALAVDGTLSMGGFTLGVQQTAMLAGFGQIVGNTTIAGTLSPGQVPNVADQVANNGLAVNTAIVGTSTGTLTFQGNVTLTATANTRINVDGNLTIPGGPGTFSKIVVTGANNTFALNGALNPQIRDIPGGNNNYSPPIGTTFRFLTAQGGATVTGQFATLTQPTVGMAPNSRFDVIYTPQSTTLSVTPISLAALTPDAKPLTETQQEIGVALDRFRRTRSVSGYTDPLLAELFEFNDDDDYANALTQLAGLGAANLPLSMMQTFQAFGNVLATRQSARVSGSADAQAAALPSSILAFGRGTDVQLSPAMMAFAGVGTGQAAGARSSSSVWGQAFGRVSRVGSTTDAPGSTSRSAGFVVGADRYLTSDWLAGLAFGFARTRASSDTVGATSDTYAGAAYSTWTPGRFVVDLRAAVGPSNLATTRTVDFMPGTMSGSTRGLGALVTGELGYRIPLANMTLKPFVGLDVQTLRRSGYTETQEIGLTYPTQTFTKVMSRVGAAASTRWDARGFVLLPELRVAWGHDLRDTTLTTQAALLDTPFEVDGAAPGRDAALVDLSITAWRNERFRLFGSVSGEFRRNATSQQIAGGLRYAW